MSALKLAGFSVCAAIMGMLLRRLRPEAGAALTLGAGAMLLVMLLPGIQQAISGVMTLGQTGGLPHGYITQLMKVGGVSLLMDFAAQTCRDAGENGLAMKTELAGRVMLILLALPFMQALLTQILSLSP